MIRRVPQEKYQLKVTRIGYEPEMIQAVVTSNMKIRANGGLGSNDLKSGNISLTGQKRGVGYVLNVG